MSTYDQIFINGELATPHGTETLALFSPVTNQQTAEVRLGDAVDVQNAIAAAGKAFKSFSQSTKAERIAWLERLHEVLNRHQQRLIDAMVEEYGGPVQFSSMLMQMGISDFKSMACSRWAWSASSSRGTPATASSAASWPRPSQRAAPPSSSRAS